MAADEMGPAAAGWHAILTGGGPVAAILATLWALKELPRYFRGVKKDWRDENGVEEDRLEKIRDKIFERLEEENRAVRAELLAERALHAQTRESEWRGWSKARWAKNELHERTHLLRTLMQTIDAAGLPHKPWPDLTLPRLELAPELGPDEIGPDC
jgi:hypothetical protein